MATPPASAASFPASGVARRGVRRWSRSGARGGGGLFAVPACLVAAFAVLPLVYIFLRASQAGMESYLRRVFSATTFELLVNTLLLMAGVVALSLALALPLAWLVSRTDLPGRRLWAVLGALPLVFPSYVAAFALVAVLGPRGYLQGWLAPLGVERLPDFAYGYPGALLALALFSYPYIYLLVVAALERLDPALEESSRALGRGRWESFFRVVLPQLRPALVGGSLLVALYVLSDFGAVSIVRFPTFTLSIYSAYQSLFDRSVAAALATVLVATSLGVLALEAWLLRRSRPLPPRPARPMATLPLGRWRWPALFFTSALAVLTLVLPLGVVTYWGLRGLWLGKSLGHAGQAAVNSLGTSAAAALVTVVLALPVAAWAVRSGGRLPKIVERLASAGFALPGLVIALSLVFFTSRFARPLYQTLAVLVAAYVVRFLPQALAALRGSLLGVSPALEEAGRSLGKSGWKVLGTITVPLVRPGLIAGAALVFLTALKELPATLLLRPIGFETLATRIWSTAAEGIYSEASLPALWLILVSAPPVYALIIRPSLAPRASVSDGRSSEEVAT